MAAKEKTRWLLLALLGLLVSGPTFASIPRSEILTSPLRDLRYELAFLPHAPDDNDALLARALDRAMPRPAPLDRYAGTRVGASDLFVPFEQQRESGLSRALRKASAGWKLEVASDPTFGKGDPVNNSDPTGLCVGLDSIDCSDYAIDIGLQFFDPRNSWGNLKRSARFLGYEAKGAALAVPRAVKGVYDVATHLPETYQGVKTLAKRVAADPNKALKDAGNAIINGDPDKIAEFVGETLLFAGVGAAAKTPQVAAALRGTAAAVETGDAARAANRARVLANIEASRAARPTENFLKYVAADAQAAGGYVPDAWQMTTLRKGALVAGGSPAGSFFTDVPTVLRSGMSQSRLWSATQVQPHAVFGPRMSVTLYELLEDARVPAGIALGNPAFGIGGGGQFFLQPWGVRKVLRPVGTYTLH